MDGFWIGVNVVTVEVTVINRLGMHARAAAMFVREASSYDSEIWVYKGKARVNGKSIMGILTLAAAMGDRIMIEAEGSDAEEAVRVLADLVNTGFGEN